MAPVVEARVTLSENSTQYLMIEEARKGEERSVWIAAWARAGATAVKPSAISLDKKQVWEQDEQILDIAFPAETMLVLSLSKLTLYARNSDRWEPRQAVPLPPSKPLPRDTRGRLRVNGATFQAFLPGMSCNGSADPSLTVSCNPGDEPWVLESGSRALLLGNFGAARNYFDGRLVTQTGLKKTIAPFYSAASTGEQGRQLWLFAALDGRTLIVDAAFDPVGSVASWGSDIVGVDSRCGGGSPVLATRPGDGNEPDAIQAFAIVNGAAIPLTAATVFPGPVTALWPSGGTAALAVARDLATGKYAAYVITLACGS